jgi:hypothetical protein
MVTSYLVVVGAVVNSHAGKKQSTVQALPAFSLFFKTVHND